MATNPNGSIRAARPTTRAEKRNVNFIGQVFSRKTEPEDPDSHSFSPSKIIFILLSGMNGL
jgi:hypothetical protein